MKQYKLLLAFILLAILSVAAKQVLNSSVFDWEKLSMKKTAAGVVRNILSGPTQTLDMFDIKAVTLNPGKETPGSEVGKDFDELIIVKEGSAVIKINVQGKVLGEGSVAVASAGDVVSIKNSQNTDLVYYFFMFKPKRQESQVQPTKKVTPLLIEWKTVEFKPSANGGRRDIMKQPTSTLKELEIHVTTLNEGLPSHSPHAHPDEEIILVRYGYVEETIKGVPFKLVPGSVIFLSNADLHGIRNAGEGKCEYYAIRWLTATEKAD